MISAGSVGEGWNDNDPDGDREVYLISRSVALSILDDLDTRDIATLGERVRELSVYALGQAFKHLRHS